MIGVPAAPGSLAAAAAAAVLQQRRRKVVQQAGLAAGRARLYHATQPVLWQLHALLQTSWSRLSSQLPGNELSAGNGEMVCTRQAPACRAMHTN